MLYNPQWQLDDVGRLLVAAADYMDQNGWCRSQIKDWSGRVCVLGAIYSARAIARSGSTPYVIDFDAHAVKRLSKHLGEWPADWNDQKCMNAKQAADALRAAACHY